MTLQDSAQYIANQLNLPVKSVLNTINLINDSATIPFIARYRKEATGNLNEVEIIDIHNLTKKLKELEERRQSIIQSMEEQGKLTDELKLKLLSVMNKDELEDLYLPYKRKKKTRAENARLAGLEPLAKIIMSQRNARIDVIAEQYISDAYSSTDLVLNGAVDIIAEWVSEDTAVRDRLRVQCRKFGFIRSELIAKKKDEASKFRDYFEYSELLHRCPSHRYLAVLRGAEEGFLKIAVEIEDERALEWIKRKYIKQKCSEAPFIEDAIEDAFKRLLFPSVETQIINEFKEKADEEAIKVFSSNLEQLLLSPPLGEKAVLAIDPGFRTGCKIVCLDQNGNLLTYDTIFPHPPQNDTIKAEDKLRTLCDRFGISAIAIGNGTASRETKTFAESIALPNNPDIFMVSESGASIYSASEIAREEFPELDLTYRGAVSIGRRLMDPLAELVKIDPRSIGVGQYQHDVHQGKLKVALTTTVESCVNRVGINLNTASKHLLSYVSGIGPLLAANIVEFRKQNGKINAREELRNVPRLGEKAFEQCAGFLRIREGKHILDNTGVHPERYRLVSLMAKDLGVSLDKLINDKSLRQNINLEKYLDENVGMPTLTDIMKELDKPGIDPRGTAQSFEFDKTVRTLEDLRDGMILPGIVTNLTNFGAFIDIGVKQEGLLHISEISDRFIKSPTEVLRVGQEITVKISGIDFERKRIHLSMKF